MIKLVRTLAVLSLLVAGGFFLSQHTTRAQDDTAKESITLSPAVVRPSFDAGQNATGKITIINDGNTSYTFLLYARPFSVTGEQYDPDYTEINERTDAYTWVQFKKTEYTLAAGQSVEVPYTIQVPTSAASGGHYAVIFAETQPPQSSANVARKKRIGSLLYMTVNGSITEEGSLQSWRATLWQKKKPILSYARVKNSGNVHFQADLHATYKNILGKTQFTLNQQILILPGTTRRIPISWSNAPYAGIFKAAGTITFLGKTTTLPTKYIVLVPTSLLIGLAVVIAVVVLLLILNKRRKPKPAHFSGHARR